MRLSPRITGIDAVPQRVEAVWAGENGLGIVVTIQRVFDCDDRFLGVRIDTGEICRQCAAHDIERSRIGWQQSCRVHGSQTGDHLFAKRIVRADTEFSTAVRTGATLQIHIDSVANFAEVRIQRFGSSEARSEWSTGAPAMGTRGKNGTEENYSQAGKHLPHGHKR